MAKKGNKYKWLFTLLRLVMIGLFMGGFIYQTLQFLFLYWTFPTVVDIQQSSPSYVEIPAFTFCNRIGYNYLELCSRVKSGCPGSLFTSVAKDVICPALRALCINNGTTLPPGFQPIYYNKIMESYSFKTTDFPVVAQRLEEYLECTIEFAGSKIPCNMENVLGSFYSTDDLPQFCFTIYSSWGKPNKKREVIPKGATMKFHLFLNISRQPPDSPSRFQYTDGFSGPLNNPPCDATVQIAVHSPYFLPSPYFEGYSFIGGKAYEMRIKLSESHLLPLPYQTNCTDYMTLWYERGGKAPINQLSLIQECRINKTYEAISCIPLTLDYPHEFDICPRCPKPAANKIPKPCKYVEAPNECTLLADSYNQPCDSMDYIVAKEDKVIRKFERAKSEWLNDDDGITIILEKHDCDGQKLWRPECSTIDIDVPFDRFEITNITYNPKFESLELFSVIGGYMGMWLGISLLTVFDLFADIYVWIRDACSKRRRKRSRVAKMKSNPQDDFANGINRMQRPTYNVW